MASFAAAFCGIACSNLQARPDASQETQQAPPVPEIYDPRPGPFLAVVDGKGALVDTWVVANAVQSWAGGRLAAFLLCFQAGAKPIDWKLAFDALDNVARELKGRGAEIVVVQPARACATPPAPTFAGKPHVEITGVLRSRD